VPMTDAIESNLGRNPDQLSADAGYCSEANLEALENRNIDAYVATGRARDAVASTVKDEVTAASPEPAGEPTRVEAMRAKIKAGGFVPEGFTLFSYAVVQAFAEIFFRHTDLQPTNRFFEFRNVVGHRNVSGSGIHGNIRLSKTAMRPLRQSCAHFIPHAN